MSGLIGVLGVIAILGIAVLLSSNRKAINLRIVGAAFALQAVTAVVVVYSEAGKVVIQKMSNGVQHVMDYSQEGIDFIFRGLAGDGYLVAMDGDAITQGEPVWSFAINVLPIIIFFSALTSVLYHLRIMQVVVKAIGGALRWIIGTKAVESVNAAANIFIGQTEAPLVVRPYLKTLTEPQLFAVMVSGVASVAGTVLLAYAQMGAELKYLLAASFMAAPGGLLMAKIIMPDDEMESAAEDNAHLEMADSEHVNVILAAAAGTSDGVKLAVNIGAMLLAFIALIAVLNGIVGGVAGLAGFEDITLQKLLGWLFAPLMYLLSIPWDEAKAAGSLFGEKIILNEFYAYSHLTEYLKGMSAKTHAIVTFSLCGFANLSSIAILLGGLGSLVPEKKDLIARFGLKAVAAGSLSNLMSAALAGLLLSI
jgi:CNT family concentrative nucleoside transporter